MLQQQVEDAAQHAQTIKKRRCEEEGRVDIILLAEIFRGSGPVALAFLIPKHATVLRDLRLLVTGFDADAVVFTMEGYRQRFRGNNPVTGKPVVMGDYQTLAEQHDGIAKGWVQETINTFGANRAGDIIALTSPYNWEGDLPVFEQTYGMREPGGGLPTALVQMMNIPGASTQFLREHGVTSLPERTERDIIVGRMLSTQINGQVGLLAHEDQTERFEHLNTITKEHPALFKTWDL